MFLQEGTVACSRAEPRLGCIIDIKTCTCGGRSSMTNTYYSLYDMGWGRGMSGNRNLPKFVCCPASDGAKILKLESSSPGLYLALDHTLICLDVSASSFCMIQTVELQQKRLYCLSLNRVSENSDWSVPVQSFTGARPQKA